MKIFHNIFQESCFGSFRFAIKQTKQLAVAHHNSQLTIAHPTSCFGHNCLDFSNKDFFIDLLNLIKPLSLELLFILTPFFDTTLSNSSLVCPDYYILLLLAPC